MDKASLLAALQAALKAQEIEALEQIAIKALDEYEQEAFPYFFLGEANVLKQKYANTELCLAKAIEIDPGNTTYILRLASVKELQHQYDDAQLLYQNVLKIDASNTTALLGLAHYFSTIAEEEEEAMNYINKALTLDSNNAQLYALRARTQILFNNIDAAKEDVEQSLNINKNEAAYLLKIKIYSELNDQNIVNEAYSNLVTLLPGNPFHRMNYATQLLNQKEAQLAEEQLNILITQEREQGEVSAESLELLGIAHSEQKQFEAALEIFSDLIRLNTKNWSLYTKRANVYLAQGNQTAALEDFSTAEQYVSEASKPELRFQKAQLLLELSQDNQAIAILDELKEDEAYTKAAYFILAKAMHNKGERSMAYEYLKIANQKRYAPAKAYIAEHFTAELEEEKAQAMQTVASNSEQNAASDVLSRFHGQVWLYDEKKNKLPQGLPPAVLKQIEDSVKNVAFMISEKGIMMVSPMNKKALNAAYTIAAEDGKQTQVEIQPFDGSKIYEVGIAYDGKHLAFSPKGSPTPMYLKGLNAEELSTKEKNFLKSATDKENFELLGTSAEAFVQVLF